MEPPHAPDLRERLVASFVAVFLVVQLGLPMAVLAGWETDRFGWQMFAHRAPAPTIEVLYHDRTERAVELDELTPVRRADVPYDRYLGPYLCRNPQVDQVRVESSTEEVVHRCP